MNILLSFLLFYLLHHVSFLLAISNKNSVIKTYGHSLINSTFYRNFGITWDDCLQRCKDIRKCKSINYIRKTGFCELNDGDQTTNPDALQTRMGSIFSCKHDWNFEEPEQCTSCSDGESCSSDHDKQCEIIGCPPAAPVAGATILGNLFNLGTKRLYRCSDGVQQVSVCQKDGSWSPVNITCSCGEIEIENASVNITEYEDGGKTATITCKSEYFQRYENKSHCSAATLEWTNIKQVGCIAIYVDPWTIVYRTLKELKTNPFKVWKGEEHPGTGEFRNNEVFSKWNSIGTGIKFVKIDIKDISDQIVAHLIFNGTGADFVDWFSLDRLINSSWDDLTGISEVDFFTIRGVNVNPTGNVKWTILNMANADKRLNCSTELIWLAVVRAGNYPCNKARVDGMTGRVIVYSKSQTGVSWEDEKLGLAEEMVVSVIYD